jgi:hypothetical protein
MVTRGVIGKGCEMDQPVGRVVVARPRGGRRDRARRYVVKVDGVRAGTLTRDSSLELVLPVGEHRLQGRLDWCRSREVTLQVDPGAEICLTLEPAGNSLQMYQMVLPQKYLKLTRQDSPAH